MCVSKEVRGNKGESRGILREADLDFLFFRNLSESVLL